MKKQQRDLLLLREGDNVLVTCRYFNAGETVEIDGENVLIDKDTPVGHKLARVSMSQGDVVIKCGMTIGECTNDTLKGSQLHTHNVGSLYIASHMKGGAKHG
ncbi:UxaA family hydrolase [Parasalinivibrio latis]|uniref:UxaA family hydrolase n=1 Tax=Parasalinivibrio latis TaxID=2952610 RepID=UPI0030E592DE